MVRVPIWGDDIDEPDETFDLVLSNPAGAVLGDGTGHATIVDDEATPAVSVADVSVVEGNGTNSNGTHKVNVVFEATLSGRSAYDLIVRWTVELGTATAEDVGMLPGLPRPGITFAPGETTARFAIAVNSDLHDEPDETLIARLFPEAHVVPGRVTATATIVDDDPPWPGPTAEPLAAPFLDAADMPAAARLPDVCPLDRKKRPTAGGFEGHVAISDVATATWKLSAEMRARTARGRPGKLTRLQLGSRRERVEPFEVDFEVPISRARCTLLRNALKRAFRGRGTLVVRSSLRGGSGKTAAAVSRVSLRR